MSHVSLGYRRVGVGGGGREEKLDRVDPIDDLVDLLQMLERHVPDGEVVGERRSQVVRVSFSGSIGGSVVPFLKEILEAVCGIGEVSETKRYSYVHVGGGGSKMSNLIEDNLMGLARRQAKQGYEEKGSDCFLSLRG